ncbi:MAG: ATP-binding cassette domain-containing protein [Anaerolineales bacterium]|jgi:energy-coupling factor transporter ATP-binding protein EcfA2
MSVIIEIKDYSWQYLNTKQPALQEISLQIEDGMFVGIIGANGAGKTSLAFSMNGLIPGQYNGIKHGEVLVYGKEVEEYGHGELQRFTGMVFSDPEAQFTAMTVEDELVFGLENLGMTIPEIRERLEWVTHLTGLETMLLKPPYELSGGQKQRVALAAVLAMTPKLLILDEPTTMLDPVSRRRVFEVLAKLKQEQNNTIIVIEHSLENLIRLADHMILLSDSHLLLEGETKEFFQNMELISKEGIHPPGALQFFYELKKAGIVSGKLPISLSESSEQLKQLFK